MPIIWILRIALTAVLLAASASGAQTRVSDRQIVDLAGNSEFLKLLDGLESEGLPRLDSTGRVHALCFAYSRIKRYRKLLDCLDELDARLKKRDTESILFALDDATPDSLLMRAGAYVDLARYPEAAATAASALGFIRKQSGIDRDMEMQALSLLVIGAALTGDKPEAEKHLAALEIVPAGGGVLSSRDFATIKSIALGRAYIALERYADAIRVIESDKTFKFNAALDNFMSGASARGRNSWRWQELPRLYIVSHALLRMGRIPDAKANLDRLLAIRETSQNGEIYWNSLFDRGTIAAQEGDRAGAIEFFRRAIEAIEEQRSSISNETSKIGFLRDKQEPFDRIIRLLFDAGRPGEVFDFIERAKSRAMLDLLAGKVTFNEPELTFEGGAAAFANPRPDRMQIQVSALRRARSGSAAEIAKLGFSLPAAVDPESDFGVLTLSAKELAQTQHANEAIVQYFLGNGYLAISALSRDGQFAVVRPIGAIAQDVETLYKLASNYKSAPRAVAEVSARVYAELIAPIEPHIRGKNLTFVPHGSLHYVPFGALHAAGSDKVLIDEHTIRILPSASLVGILSNEKPSISKNVMVIGNPTLDLPGAEFEAKSLAAKVPGAKLFLRESATRDTFVRNAGLFGRIHIAAHAKFFADKPLESAILFAPSGGNNGMVTVRDLYRLRMDADLVVLSACETGMSKVHKGDELVGLIRGFLYGGSRSIIATLWEIEDESASLFSTTLYDNLAKMDKPSALRNAVLTVKKKFPHPLFWAPFMFTGGV